MGKNSHVKIPFMIGNDDPCSICLISHYPIKFHDPSMDKFANRRGSVFWNDPQKVSSNDRYLRFTMVNHHFQYLGEPIDWTLRGNPILWKPFVNHHWFIFPIQWPFGGNLILWNPQLLRWCPQAICPSPAPSPRNAMCPARRPAKLQRWRRCLRPDG